MLVLCAPQSICGETTRTDTGSFSPVGQSVSEEKQLEHTQGHFHLWVTVQFLGSDLTPLSDSMSWLER